MNDAEPKGTTLTGESWEADLWSYINSGDGIHCPLSKSCRLPQSEIACFNDEAERAKVRKLHLFIDVDSIDPSRIAALPQLSECTRRDEVIIELVRKLARKYRELAWDGTLPVPEDIVKATPDGYPIEVRRVPLKAIHGAVWHTDDGWIIYLNSASSLSRQRFTLYHEVFHVLAHCHGHTVFKKSEGDEVYFNEFIADHFSANILLPYEKLLELWPQIRDINRMARLFDIPASIMFGGLRKKKLL